MRNFEETINTIRKTYIKAYGIEKWVSMTDDQKHDVIMAIARILLKTLDNLSEMA